MYSLFQTEDGGLGGWVAKDGALLGTQDSGVITREKKVCVVRESRGLVLVQRVVKTQCKACAMLPWANYLEVYCPISWVGVRSYLWARTGRVNQLWQDEELQTNLTIDQEEWWCNLFWLVYVN